MRSRFTFAAIAALALPSMLSAQTALDGILGAEWTGVNSVSVLYDPGAPTSNFGSPTNRNHVTGYQIFMRRDANWVYTALRTTGTQNSAGFVWANLYYGLRTGPGPYGNAGGSTISFEVANDRAFLAGGSCCFNDTPANLIQYVTGGGGSSPTVFESAIHLSAFTNNALGVTGYNPDPAAVGIRLNLSQSFGYSVAGGQADYGDSRLGFVSLAVVPEPSTYALMIAGLAAVGVAARRRRRQ